MPSYAKLCQARTFSASALPGLRWRLKVLKLSRNLVSSPPSFDHHNLNFILIILRLCINIRILNPYRQPSPLSSKPHKLYQY